MSLFVYKRFPCTVCFYLQLFTKKDIIGIFSYGWMWVNILLIQRNSAVTAPINVKHAVNDSACESDWFGLNRESIQMVFQIRLRSDASTLLQRKATEIII